MLTHWHNIISQKNWILIYATIKTSRLRKLIIDGSSEFWSVKRTWTVPIGVIQVGLVLHDFFLHDFAVTPLLIYTTFQMYMIIFGLTWFGIDNLWPQEASRQGCHCHTIQSLVWYDYVGDIIMQVIYFPLQQHWIFLPTWARNVILYRVMQSKWNISKGQVAMKRLDIISWLDKGEQIVDICHTVRLNW